MPEITSTGRIIIPIRDSGRFIDLFWKVFSASRGIHARIGHLKGGATNQGTTIQAMGFETKKGWTMSKAKGWVKEHRKEL